MSNEKVIDLENLSPKAVQTIEKLSRNSGHESVERTVEELAFAMMELLQLIDTSRDPMLEPEYAEKQMQTIRGVLQRFKRFEAETP